MTGPELVAARTRMGLTQDALATRLGVHVDTVSRWERGARKMPSLAERVVAIMEAVEAKWLEIRADLNRLHGEGTITYGELKHGVNMAALMRNAATMDGGEQ